MNKRTKRSRDTIVLEILNMCSKGSNKTAIVHKLNLNFDIVSKYLTSLNEKDLIIARDGKPIIYITTSKGTELLDTLRSIHNELKR